MKIKMLAAKVAIGCVGTLAIAASIDGSIVAQTANPIRQRLESVGIALVMPSYVPTGFELTSFEMRVQTRHPGYNATYSSSSDSCKITVGGAVGGWGGPGFFHFEEVSTPLFGNLFLGRLSTEQPDFADRSLWQSLAGRGLVHTTPVLPGFPDVGYIFGFSCEDSAFSIQEAAKILKSMQIVE